MVQLKIFNFTFYGSGYVSLRRLNYLCVYLPQLVSKTELNPQLQIFFCHSRLCIYYIILYIVCILLIRTYSMVQSPPWEANWFAASQEIPRISRNPKVHYRTHKRPPPVSILDQPNPVPTSHLLEIHPNIIHPSTPRSPQWSLSLRFPHQDPIHPLFSPIRATCPAHLLLLDFITRTILGEQYRPYWTLANKNVHEEILN